MGKKIALISAISIIILAGSFVIIRKNWQNIIQIANPSNTSSLISSLTQPPLKGAIDNPEQVIRDKIAEIDRISVLISRKKREVLETKKIYEDYNNTALLYIKLLRKELNVSTFAEGLKVPDIDSNIQLMIKYTYYLKRLKEFEDEFREAEEELSYLKRDAEADLPMIKIIDKKEIGNLINKISLVIQKHGPEVGNIVVPPPSQGDLTTGVDIWNDIVSQTNAPAVQP